MLQQHRSQTTVPIAAAGERQPEAGVSDEHLSVFLLRQNRLELALVVCGEVHVAMSAAHEPLASMTTLSRTQARATYDRIGARQDTQAFYEDPATDLIRAHGDFGTATSVFELGCGTGRFARRLLDEHLPPEASYRGADLSPNMVELARERLAPYSARAEVLLSNGGPPSSEPEAAYDRFVSNYVFDLLSEDEIRATLVQAHRMLRPDGLLCLSGLGCGAGAFSKLVARALGGVQRLAPKLIGGCRPLDLAAFLAESEWQIELAKQVVAYGIPSAIVVARRR